MIRLLLSLLLAGCLALVVNAQSFTTSKTTSEKALKYYKEGRSDEHINAFAKAISSYRKALKEDPGFIDPKIRIAAIQAQQNEMEAARDGFRQVLAVAPDYSSDVYYILGYLEWNLDEFDQAAIHFRGFLDREKRNERWKEKAQKYLRDSKFSAQAVKNPVPFVPHRLSDSINSEHLEYLPIVSADGEMMIFARRIGNNEDFYISKKKDGVWTKAFPMESINSPLNEASQSISADGRYFVFTACNREDGLGSCDIYLSEKVNGQWELPQCVGGPVCTSSWESQPSLSADGKTLYFCAERADGKGGRDIFVSYRNGNGSWTNPVNVGTPINTEWNEQSPFIHPDGETLYFMSTGHPGMGGYDLFYSRRQPDGKWGEPVNLGYPINTEDNEGALFISLDGETAYFASDKSLSGGGATEAEKSLFEKANAASASDIYSFELYPEARPKPVTYAKAKVKDADTGKPLVAEVDFIKLENEEVLYADSTDEAGEFLVCLPAGQDYALNVSKKGYLFHSNNFALKETATFEEPFIMEILLEKIPLKDKASKPVVLRNVFFETGSAELKKESTVELNRLKSLMENHPSMKIELRGHTDNVGSEEDNLRLSVNRARAVYDFLVKNGIAEERLSFKGFGESQPVDTNDTGEGRQNNRRTEFVVLKG